MRKNHKSTQLNCFSPPVMIATMVIEVSLAIYTVWRYKMTNTGRLAVVTLTMLASFQLAEFFVCTGTIGHATVWSRIGFAALATLPPLGLHLMHRVADKPGRRLVITAYATMTAFIVFFLAFPAVFNNYQCTGNYVVFHLRPHAGGLFWVFYMGWLAVAAALGVRWANQFMKQRQIIKLKATRGLIIGWLAFLVPTAIANIVSPASRTGIPSVMCGFAVIFAFILVLYVVPKSVPLREQTLTKAKN
jgi:hypothetical protein